MQTATAWSYNPTHAVTWVVWAVPRSLATTGGIIIYFLFLQVLRCFSSLRSPPTIGRIPALQAGGLSHSEIRGSRDICSYPRLIAAYHVLHRLHEPRHPPCALYYFRFPAKRPDAHTFSSSSHIHRTCRKEFPVITVLLVSICQRSLSQHKGSVENNGFEPLTPCLQSRCSSQLS